MNTSKIYEILGIPFGFVISLFYAMTDNYLLSIVCLMIIVKLCLLPSSVKQQKAQAKQARLQPKLRRIQKNYEGNQQKIQDETQNLYRREGFSAMGGGCMPMIIQLIVMTGLFQVNYHPFSMVLNIRGDVLSSIKEAVMPLLTETEAKGASFRIELYALQHWSDIRNSVAGLTPEMISKVDLFLQRFTVFGLDLSHTPNFRVFDVYWAIPIITGVLSLAMSVYSLLRQKKLNPEMSKNPTIGCMMLFTPAMQIYFAFLFPTVVGIYVIMSTVVSFAQMVVLNITHSPQKVLAKLMVEETVERRSKEANIKKIAERKS